MMMFEQFSILMLNNKKHNFIQMPSNNTTIDIGIISAKKLLINDVLNMQWIVSGITSIVTNIPKLFGIMYVVNIA